MSWPGWRLTWPPEVRSQGRGPPRRPERHHPDPDQQRGLSPDAWTPARSAQLRHVDRRLHRRHLARPPAALQRRRLRPRRRRPGGVRRDPIGATTLRRDNPRLLVNSAERRAEREARGLPAFPLKVTVTASGDLSPDLKFWHHGGAKVVYCPDSAQARLNQRLGDLADIVALGPALDFGAMLNDLRQRGVGRLMVEGGSEIHTQFLTNDLADEIHLAIAPFFIGDPAAPHFVRPGSFPHGPSNRMMLVGVRTIGDIALLRYETHHHER